MTDDRLDERCILVVEDEYFIVKELCVALRARGATVIGPVSSVEQAVALAEQTERIDGAILDVNLGGEMVYPAADLLAARGVPVAFTTGYDEAALPPRFQNIVRCEKPADSASVLDALSSLIQARLPTAR